jgi:hypothetical protein
VRGKTVSELWRDASGRNAETPLNDRMRGD